MARQLAEILAAFSCAAFFGAAAYISLVQHPAAMETGSDFAVRFFAPMYRRAAIMHASLAVAGAVFASLAYFLGAGRVWLLSAVLIASVVPFTLLVIRPVNEEIKALVPSSAHAMELLVRWGRLHWVRTAVSGAAVIICLAAIVSPYYSSREMHDRV
jgi:hypothetical protein